MLTVGSLFSGIGGFDLGLERAGMRTLWFCEQDPFCRRVLARHWPGVPCHPDVRALVGDTDRSPSDSHAETGGSRPATGESGRGMDVPVSVPYVDVLCGGFPCQDISLAGRGAGLAGERSGLWREFARLIGELRPRYVLVENVPALTSRGLDIVLADLAACGFDAEWDHLPASAFGAPHRRDRIWLVAYPGEERWDGWPGVRGDGRDTAKRSEAGDHTGNGRRASVADADAAGLEGHRRPVLRPGERPAGPNGARAGGLDGHADHWLAEPDVGRVAHGIPARVDRLRALGNALVPQTAEWIGRRIIEWESVTA